MAYRGPTGRILRAGHLAGRLAGDPPAPAVPQRDGSPEVATLCHEPTAGQDLPGGGRASNADQLPAAVRDKHRL